MNFGQHLGLGILEVMYQSFRYGFVEQVFFVRVDNDTIYKAR